MTHPTPGLGFNFDWERGGEVVAPELAATWARLEIRVGEECATQVQDPVSGSARRSIYCSLYPLAEWIAFNWWYLNAHLRPASLAPPPWVGARPALNGAAKAARQHHNLRSVGEGFLWPNMSILPEGRATRLLWHADPSAPRTTDIRYLGQGDARLSSDFVERSLADFVETVLTRLEEQQLDATVLKNEWRAIQEASSDERQFCIAAARLGLDAYEMEPTTARLLSGAAETLEAEFLEEFLSTVDPSRIGGGLQWIDKATAHLQRMDGGPSERLLALRAEVGGVPLGSSLPWEIGYAEAQKVRYVMGLTAPDPFDLVGLLTIGEVPHDDRGLQGLGGVSDSGKATLVLGRPARTTVSRFAAARALWHLVYEPDRRRFLMSEVYGEPQRIERAFAAELLAPAAGLSERFDDGSGVVSQADLEEAAESFQVSPLVVWHQVQNQLDLTVVD